MDLETEFLKLKERADSYEQGLRELSERLGEATVNDGPRAPDLFMWQGRHAWLSPDQFRLAHELWQSPEHRRNRQELAVELFDDEERATKTLANIARKLTAALGKRGIPLIVEPVGNEIWMFYPDQK